MAIVTANPNSNLIRLTSLLSQSEPHGEVEVPLEDPGHGRSFR